MKILIATTSVHKADEIAQMLSEVPGLTIETLRDYPVTEAPDEDGETTADNARIKAEYYAQHYQTLVLADDSGLEVDALDGEPGVRSARWADGSDADRTLAILERMKDVEEEERGARYRCSLCLAGGMCLTNGSGIKFETEGTCEGAIAFQLAGENGFGYDPIFQITLATGAASEYVGQTLGQAPPEVKASVSHRARAVKTLASHLQKIA